MAQNPRPPVRPAPAPLAPPSTPPLPEESDEAESFWDKLFREPPTPAKPRV